MKKINLANIALSACMLMFASCQKDAVVPFNSDASNQNSTEQTVDGWPDGMVHLNELDSIK